VIVLDERWKQVSGAAHPSIALSWAYSVRYVYPVEHVRVACEGIGMYERTSAYASTEGAPGFRLLHR